MLTEQFAMCGRSAVTKSPNIHGAIDFISGGQRYQMVILIQCPQCGAIEFITKEKATQAG